MHLPPGQETSFAVRDRVMTVRAGDDAVRDFFRTGFASLICPPPPPGRARDCAEVTYLPGRSRMWFRSGEGEARALPLPHAEPFLVAFYAARDLFGLSARQAAGCWLFHGAAFALDGRAHAIVGPSGIGKTTLLLQALARGASFLGDEYIFFDRATRHVAGLQRELFVRGESLRALPAAMQHALRQLPARMWCEPVKLWYGVDHAQLKAGDATLADAPLASLTLLARAHDGEPAVRELAPALAALELAQRLYRRPDNLAQIRALAGLLAPVHCRTLAVREGADNSALLLEACA